MTWKKSEYKQLYMSTNDEKNEAQPVVFFGVFQHLAQAHEIRDEWRSHPEKNKYRVRVYERSVRVDSVITQCYCTVVRRRVAA